MNFEFSDKVRTLQDRLTAFMDEHIYPIEGEYSEHVKAAGGWTTPPIMDQLKEKARAEGLWNLFLPDEEHGAGLNNLEYAPLAEIMGRVDWSSEAFNCSAPDTGNMEVLARYGTQEQQDRWLTPMLNGEIRSCFSMTEPAVASSDATNIECQIQRDGDEYVINGRKWFSSGFSNERCKVAIVMGKSDPDNENRYVQQSMILVPKGTPGMKMVRNITTFGYTGSPGGHPEVLFEDVRVPVSNMLLGEGRGFEIAQGRLGPGRIHHCMRFVGSAQRALELMCQRAENRSAFGMKLSEHGSLREDIARSFCEIEQARLLTLMAADKMDREGNKAARDLIGAAKIVVPAMTAGVIDRAIQIHGAMGFTEDTFLPKAYAAARYIRVGDGPDQVHMSSLARQLLRQHAG
ncbi:MAG: acyl-CoA dehydrogenase family protein [Pseudomonadales bacterium]|mgnify:CR=1 FL=1|jgi:acyl-CoA dehydrogenase|nr:acyl-CoA dehydrogenase family protein [Pseudomonadales bacterium]MDP6471129.1 acyl-CoA dehydrogenase family protein [Pseudomonadales bacterium]MDP6825685.1 acyl-CoA dehydrogenase family protein [Pseudomonadales bacterium]MDP6973141.1 acyl-CoA dehydrogenase family protein [Pseudomonadales bacterium]|tara:strand:+ start:1712 stop:2920 length:1209 start_codon:yes stop_codon:yes gene_type:complete